MILINHLYTKYIIQILEKIYLHIWYIFCTFAGRMVILFNNTDKKVWLHKIVDVANYLRDQNKDKVVILDFATSIKKSNILPIHIVTYACLIQYLKEHGFEVQQGKTNIEVADYIYYELGLKYYWRGTNHIEVADTSILNLWRVVVGEAESYSHRIEDYFKNNYFKNKDLSAVYISMVEAFYNISDHAEAGENSFSLIMYNHDRKELKVAISDWGKGIVGTVRDFDASIKSDTEALERAIRDDFTISSTTHNKGKGLENILSSSDTVRIFSGNALLVKTGNKKRFYDVETYYPGTLIYFDKNLTDLEDIDILDDFNW